MKYLAMLFIAFACLISDVSTACGPHGGCGGGVAVGVGGGGCGGGVAVGVGGGGGGVAVGVGGGGCGGGCGGGFGPGFGPRPLLAGGGAVAFRRSRRLARRANRAAFFGFPGRANNLAFRSQAAFGRAQFRNARFNGF